MNYETVLNYGSLEYILGRRGRKNRRGFPPKVKRYIKKVYKKALLAVLGTTRGLYRLNVNFPSRWKGLFDTLQVSSGLAYTTLSSLDEEVDKEVQEWETRFERSFGDRKFYSEDELDKISKEFSHVDVR